ncbi:hypothetical protein [Glutamicibacter sp. PS]|uniref:hypothetical protein n=1 Tax=Glutamicibacter sp. PS TaxID=3075634 RepID=UPI00284406B4|nr:hypothetical protein [Glutamicibacter sp. PS]MDR4534772.1 hypothetical protein [Glutamicibacter sp. PS]
MGVKTLDLPTAARQAIRAHELLASSGAPLEDLPLRQVVRESWTRALGSQPSLRHEPSVLSDAELAVARERSALQRLWPVFERLLVPAAAEANLVVALADARGTLLWVDGARRVARRAESVGFAPGADWAEPSIGTSAPGIALATGTGVQVAGAEHMYEHVHSFSCSAVPIRNPRSGQIIGAVDLTGGEDAVAVHSLPLLTAAVAAAEGQLLLPEDHCRESEGDYLDLCAPTGALLNGEQISLRHAEILTLLATSERGMSNQELVEALFEVPDAAAAGTVRSEMVRLRKVLAGRNERTLGSRPYRVQWPLRTSVHRLMEALEAGDVQQMLEVYPADLLARSLAPGIHSLRHRLQAAARELVLDRGGAHQLLDFGRRSADAHVLLAALRELPADSPARSLIVAEVQNLQDS